MATPRPDTTRRPATGEHAADFDKYIACVADGDVLQTLRTQGNDLLALIRSIPESRGGHRYAEGKWTIREVVGHIIDAERVFSDRALRFARDDQTPLPSFDEDAYVASGFHDERTLASLADELAAVRQATLALFGGLNAVEWARSGTANHARMSVRAAVWVIAGHARHHGEILASRYLA